MSIERNNKNCIGINSDIRLSRMIPAIIFFEEKENVKQRSEVKKL